MADQPNYTRVPNDLIAAMPTLGNAELRVALALARKTVGYQKECDRISVSQLAAMTGLTNRNTQQAITALLKRGLIERTPAGKQAYCYSLKTISLGDTDQNHIPSDTISLGDTEPYPLGTQLNDSPYPLGITQKKDLKEKKEKIRAPRKSAGAPADQPPVEKTDHQRIMDAYASALGYRIKDGAKEGNAAKWLVNNHYTPEQVQACYAHLKVQAFYADKHLSLQTVASQIGAFLQAQNGHRNGSSKLLRQGDHRHSERGPITKADEDKW